MLLPLLRHTHIYVPKELLHQQKDHLIQQVLQAWGALYSITTSCRIERDVRRQSNKLSKFAAARLIVKWIAVEIMTRYGMVVQAVEMGRLRKALEQQAAAKGQQRALYTPKVGQPVHITHRAQRRVKVGDLCHKSLCSVPRQATFVLQCSARAVFLSL